MFSPGDLLAQRYRIVHFLAQGGMGEVYEAEDVELREKVALKTISSGSKDTAAIDRFKREIALARKVTHPNVCRIFDLGQHVPESGGAGVTFLTMELLEGETLSKCLRRRGRLPTREALPVARQVADALDAAHNARVVHRDLKSENIFLVREAGMTRAVVTDFGIARGGRDDQFAAMVTGTDIVGTPAYMAPEQVEGKTVTAAADIYAFGVVLYEMVTGRLPFESDNPITTAAKRLQEPPRPPRDHVADLETRWERAILRCLERHPEGRFATAKEVTAALEDVSVHSTHAVPTRTPQPPTQGLPPRTPAPPTQGHPSHVPPTQGHPSHVPPAQGHPSYVPPTQGQAIQAQQPSAVAQPVAAQLPASAPVVEGARTSGVPVTLQTRALYPSAGVRRSSLRPLLITLGIVAVLSVGLLLFNFLRGDGLRRAPRLSVAVLGFRDQTGQEDQAWLATALAEMLGTELERGEHLRTIPGDQVARARKELGLEGVTDLSADHLRQVHAVLGCDFVIYGTFLPQAQQLRIDLRLSDAAVGKQLASFIQAGDEAKLFEIVRTLGSDLRKRLGVKDGGGGPDPLAGLPTDRQASRLYSEALDSLRRYDARAARDALREAARIEPENPLIHSALSSAWKALGHGQRAAQEARQAFEHSSDLPREDRMVVEGRFRETEGNWNAAIQVYQALWDFFPDNLEYGLRLTAAQTSARRPGEALASIARLRELPPPISEDVRIDLAEAVAAAMTADYPVQLEAAERGARKAEQLGAALLEAEARLAVSQAHYFLGRPTESEAAARKAHQLYDKVGQPAGSALALVTLANAQFDLARFDDAILRSEEAIEIYKGLGNEGGLASALNTLALGLKKKGDLDRALALYGEAEKTLESTGNQLGLANALNNRAAILIVLDQLREAREMLERAKKIWELSGERRGQAFALNNLAHVMRLEGDLGWSRVNNEEALEIRRNIGQKNGEVFSLLNLGAVTADIGDLVYAEELLGESCELAKQKEYRSALGYCLYETGRLRLVQGRYDAALSLQEEALAIRRELDEKQSVAESQTALARLKLTLGDAANAEIAARHAIDAFGKNSRRAEEGRANALLAMALAEQKHLVEARRTLQDAKRLGGSSQQFAIRFRIRFAEARLAAAGRQTRTAVRIFQQLEAEAKEAGFTALSHETRLERLLIELRTGSKSRAANELLELQREAAAKGFGWIDKKVTSALQ